MMITDCDEQRAVRRRARLLELLDRQVVDRRRPSRPGRRDSARRPRRDRCSPGENLRRSTAPSSSVFSRRECLRAVPTAASSFLPMPPRLVMSTTRARPISRSSESASTPGPSSKKCFGRVDVRAGVRAHDQLRHVGTAAGRNALDGLQLELGVPGIGGNACSERHAHVQEFRYASHKPVMISPEDCRRSPGRRLRSGFQWAYCPADLAESGAEWACSGASPYALYCL